MEHTKMDICEDVVSQVEVFAYHALIQLDLPILQSNYEKYEKQFYDQFTILSYDLIFFTTNELSDIILYEVKDKSNFTEVNLEFYNQTLEKAKEDLRSQTGAMLTTLVKVNYTYEEASMLLYTMLLNVYEYIYSDLRDACVKEATATYMTNDLAHLTRDYMKDNLARVDIYFETLNVEEIKEQKAYEFYSVVCDLGGALGLFFGASLVAFVEAIDFWIIRGCFCRKKKKTDLSK
ncbi:uncharacterized protein [Antedon mediterranea]|uniref:uncharacterized protein n=1 Tax=Antedon mediterranea TaxID=105859 RepID=UPI003AF60665